MRYVSFEETQKNIRWEMEQNVNKLVKRYRDKLSDQELDVLKSRILEMTVNAYYNGIKDCNNVIDEVQLSWLNIGF